MHGTEPWATSCHSFFCAFDHILHANRRHVTYTLDKGLWKDNLFQILVVLAIITVAVAVAQFPYYGGYYGTGYYGTYASPYAYPALGYRFYGRWVVSGFAAEWTDLKIGSPKCIDICQLKRYAPITQFRPHNGPRVNSASNRNEYKKYFPGEKAACA